MNDYMIAFFHVITSVLAALGIIFLIGLANGNISVKVNSQNCTVCGNQIGK